MVNVAITGTKGKTTIMYLVKHVFRALGKNVMTVSSTEGIYYNDTFLRKPEVETYLNKDFDRPIDVYISEATSKMLALGKYDNEKIDMVLYTGIEEYEHLETHETFENYLNAKKKLIEIASKNNSIVFINGDDKYRDEVKDSFFGNSYKLHFYGNSNNIRNTFTYDIESINENLMKLILHDNSTNYFINIESKITGEYNAKNILASVLILNYLYLHTDKIKKHIKTFSGVPGRFQKFKLDNDRIVIIDYAHTENSLRLVLEHIKELYPDKRIITIFGCGGNRTPEKRPRMGKVASDNSDFVYVTDDNPRKEKANEIRLQIINGINKFNYMIIENRQDAIKNALMRNKKDTIILIAGKGSEVENIDKRNGSFNLSDEQRLRNVCEVLGIELINK